MVMRLIPWVLPLLGAVSIYGQGLAPGPGSMQTLKEVLTSQKPVNWAQIPTNPELSAQSASVTSSITDVSVDADACTLSFKEGRVFPDQHFESAQTWKFKIPSIDRLTVESLEGFVDRLRSEGGRESWATKTKPTVYVLEIEALPNHKFDVHRWSKNKANEVLEKDLQGALAFIVFADEAGAKEAQKTMQNAKTFCASKQGR